MTLDDDNLVPLSSISHGQEFMLDGIAMVYIGIRCGEVRTCRETSSPWGFRHIFETAMVRLTKAEGGG